MQSLAIDFKQHGSIRTPKQFSTYYDPGTFEVPEWFWLPLDKWNAKSQKEQKKYRDTRLRKIRKVTDHDTKNFIYEYLQTIPPAPHEVQEYLYEELLKKYKNFVWKSGA